MSVLILNPGVNFFDQPGQIDSVETIMGRVEQALEYLAPERITLNPDCGFAPGSAAKVSLDEVFTKLCNEAEASRPTGFAVGHDVDVGDGAAVLGEGVAQGFFTGVVGEVANVEAFAHGFTF